MLVVIYTCKPKLHFYWNQGLDATAVVQRGWFSYTYYISVEEWRMKSNQTSVAVPKP